MGDCHRCHSLHIHRRVGTKRFISALRAGQQIRDKRINSAPVPRAQQRVAPTNPRLQFYRACGFKEDAVLLELALIEASSE